MNRYFLLVGLLVSFAFSGNPISVQAGAARVRPPLAPPTPPPPPNPFGSGLPPAVPDQEQPEVLSRGPVHEAFAGPVDLQVQAGLTVPFAPPTIIEEVPPAEGPRGEQFVWIPGYWSWDMDRNGYIWVSACWRAAPPRMSWVPGYWFQTTGGWQWAAGFWTAAAAREIEYLPAPPAVFEREPYGHPPSPDTIWVPPCMYWVQGQYVRRGGYWLAAQSDWVWVPSHYVWTPRGYVFAEGHWDYSLERRGVLFAPVFFPPAVFLRPGFFFSPSVVLNLGLLHMSLFAFPRYNHFFFGDYYDDAYISFGIFPRFDSQRLRTWYDPLYEHDRWRNRKREPRWEERERNEYQRRRTEVNLRPARTFREQEIRLARLPEPQRSPLRMLQPITEVVERRESPLKYERLKPEARQKIAKRRTEVDKFRDERKRWESVPDGPVARPPAARKPDEKPSAPTVERKPDVKPPAPTVERKPDVKPPAPPVARKPDVKPPAPDRRPEPTPPPVVERKPDVKPPAPVRRPEPTPPPVVERKPDVKPPAPPVTRKPDVKPPAAPREPVRVTPRKVVEAPQPDRVQIPTPPVVGGSGSTGLFRKGPPDRPAKEDKDDQGKEIRKDKGAK